MQQLQELPPTSSINIFNNMQEQHKQWVTDNMLIFTTSRRLTEQEHQMIFQIVSDVTNTPTKATKCGRCVTTAKQNVMYHYNIAIASDALNQNYTDLNNDKERNNN